jgi:hypothetical protein
MVKDTAVYSNHAASYTHNNHRTRSRDPLKSERGVDCTPVGESEDFHTVYASDLTPLSHARPAYPPDMPTSPHNIPLLYFPSYIVQDPSHLNIATCLHKILSKQCLKRFESRNAKQGHYPPAHLRLPAATRHPDACLHLASDRAQSFICSMHAALSIDSIDTSSLVSSCDHHLSRRESTINRPDSLCGRR